MARGSRKSIYYIGSVILVVLLFLALFLFDEDKDFQMVEINSSLGGSSDSVDLDEGGLSGGSDEDSGGGSGEDSGDGSGEDSGDGSGEGSGDGSGEDSGDGSGEGSGDGSGEGSGDGSGEGSGDGSGEGSGDGSGEGSGGGSGEGSGESGGGTGTGGEGLNVLFSVYSEFDAFLYFRQDGLGTYTGNGYHGFTGNDRYYLGDGDLNPLYYFAQTLCQSGYPQYEVIVKSGSIKSELLPYFPINLQEGNDGKSYTVSYYEYDYLAMGLGGLTPIENNPTYREQELTYRQFVKDTFLTIDPSLCETLLTIAGNNGIEKDDVNVVQKVVNYVQNAAYYDYKYADANYPSDVDMVTHFLTGERRGVCRHFAASATMMFRALGIPARYSIGFAVGVNGGMWTDVSGDGHAWTEIYIDGYGWVPLEVTGSTLAPNEDEQIGAFNGDNFYGKINLSHACMDICGKKRYKNL